MNSSMLFLSGVDADESYEENQEQKQRRTTKKKSKEE
jgi:hypothetical protein